MSAPRLRPDQLFHPPGNFLALGFGAGLSPWAPGTVGTLVAIPLYLALAGLPPGAYLGAVIVLGVAGVPLCGAAARALATHDHPGIVWDEIVGFLVIMAFLPASWAGIAAGFVLFRGFDILKPWPIGWLDARLQGGLGIMLDDVLAGLMGGAVALLLRPFLA